MKAIAVRLAKNEAEKMKTIADGVANEAMKMRAPNASRILKAPFRKYSILKGLCPPAQGCEERATLGKRSRNSPTLKGLRHCLAALEKIWKRNPFSVEAAPLSSLWHAELGPVPFPLTPALSLGERGRRGPFVEHPKRLPLSRRGEWSSLSPRERAGVRGRRVTN